MPIIAKAGSPVKGSPTQFTLDKAELLTLISDTYFLDTDNWNTVSLIYKSSEGNQSNTTKFKADQTFPAANFAVSLKAKDVFQIHKIVIKDFDNGSLEILRPALITAGIVADFDVDTTPAPFGKYRYYMVQSLIYTLSVPSAYQLTYVRFGASEFKLKWGGVAQDMSSYVFNSLLSTEFENISTAVSLINDNNTGISSQLMVPNLPYLSIPETGATHAGYMDIFSVDLGVQRAVTGFSMAPATSVNAQNERIAGQTYTIVYGSNDNSNWNLLFNNYSKDTAVADVFDEYEFDHTVPYTTFSGGASSNLFGGVTGNFGSEARSSTLSSIGSSDSTYYLSFYLDRSDLLDNSNNSFAGIYDPITNKRLGFRLLPDSNPDPDFAYLGYEVVESIGSSYDPDSPSSWQVLSAGTVADSTTAEINFLNYDPSQKISTVDGSAGVTANYNDGYRPGLMYVTPTSISIPGDSLVINMDTSQIQACVRPCDGAVVKTTKNNN